MENWRKHISEESQLPSQEVLIVGDSIAAGMIIAAHKHGFVDEPQCKGKHYWSCVTKTAKGGTSAKWARIKLDNYINAANKDTPSESGPQREKIMIVSTGTNDALAWAKKKQMKRYNPENCINEINKIASTAQSAGYKVFFKLLGPITPKNKILKERFDFFAAEVNKVIAKYDNFSAEGVAYSDFVHPSRSGSESLIKKVLNKRT